MILYSPAAMALALLFAAPTQRDKPVEKSENQTAPRTLQQDFDAASDAAARGECVTALPIFQRLEKNEHVKAGSLPAAAIAVRHGTCLVEFGDDDAGLARIRAGLPTLKKAVDSFAFDIARAERAMGLSAQRNWEHDSAVAHLTAALELSKGRDRLLPLGLLGMVTAFDGGKQPLAYIEEALSIEQSQPTPNKSVIAQLYDVRARILMNQGEVAAARADLTKALQLTGGLKLEISLTDSAIRGDLAQAALLAHDIGAAHEYMAFTGAGRIREAPLSTAAEMEPPQCGAETGLKPEDVAIVEFEITDDGSVSAPQVIYTRGSYATAAAFADAVSRWYWRPERIQAVPAFYKRRTRVEIRCSIGADRGPGLDAPLWNRVAEWASGALGGRDIAPLTREAKKALAVDLAAKGDTRGAMAANAMWAFRDRRADAEQAAAIQEIIAYIASRPDSVEITNAMRAFQLSVTQYAEAVRARKVNGGYRAAREVRAAALRALAKDASIAQDAVAQDTVLMWSIGGRSDQDDTVEILNRVADDARLGEHHPLRQAAQLQLADRAARDGKLDVAQMQFQRTGLTEQQCSLIGVKPALKHPSMVYSDYPEAAMQWGFEGWTKLEYDIAADGSTSNPRALIAYPPFVFVEAAATMTRRLRYQATYRPSGGTACSSNHQSINFALPQNH